MSFVFASAAQIQENPVYHHLHSHHWRRHLGPHHLGLAEKLSDERLLLALRGLNEVGRFLWSFFSYPPKASV